MRLLKHEMRLEGRDHIATGIITNAQRLEDQIERGISTTCEEVIPLSTTEIPRVSRPVA